MEDKDPLAVVESPFLIETYIKSSNNANINNTIMKMTKSKIQSKVFQNKQISIVFLNFL